jgi:predicted transcriptional regulator
MNIYKNEARKSKILFLNTNSAEKMGEGVNWLEKRKLTAIQIAERADIARTTLYQIETQVWQ